MQCRAIATFSSFWASRSSIGWPRRPIYFAAVLSFFFIFCQNSLMRIGLSGDRRYCTNSGAPGSTYKKFNICIFTIQRHLTHAAPFYRGQNVPNFGPNVDPSRLQTDVFLNWGALSENKNTNSTF